MAKKLLETPLPTPIRPDYDLQHQAQMVRELNRGLTTQKVLTEEDRDDMEILAFFMGGG